MPDEEIVNYTPIEVAAVIDSDGKEIGKADITRNTPVSEGQSKFPDRKVVIIGAGPAGIHMASLLCKQGYSSDQITILEKTHRACGKSCTIADPDESDTKAANSYNGHHIVHELGTCYLHPEYHAIDSLLKEYDPDNKQLGIPSRQVIGL